MEMDGNVKRDAYLGQYTKWKVIIGAMQSKDKNQNHGKFKLKWSKIILGYIILLLTFENA